MPKIYITEYQSLAKDRADNVIAAGSEPANLVQAVTFAASSVQSEAFAETTQFVRVHSDATCQVLFGSDPDAALGGTRLIANGTEFFGVRGGLKLSVIQST
ncbi:MAG: hypothetical protein ACK528_02440 [Alphaproteobacteria bacterium]